MEITVENVAKNGRGIVNNKVWYNADKSLEDGFDGVKKGDVIEAEVNGTFVKSFKIVGTKTIESKKPYAGRPAGASSGSKTDFRTPEQIMRCCAIESVFGSPSVANNMATLYDDEAERLHETIRFADKVTKYIDTGKLEAN